MVRTHDRAARLRQRLRARNRETRIGKVTFDVLQVRDSRWYPQPPVKGLRSKRALTLAPAEMCIQGVSMRNVSAITE